VTATGSLHSLNLMDSFHRGHRAGGGRGCT